MIAGQGWQMGQLGVTPEETVGTLILKAKARLSQVERDLANVTELEKERLRLRAMLAAVDSL